MKKFYDDLDTIWRFDKSLGVMWAFQCAIAIYAFLFGQVLIAICVSFYTYSQYRWAIATYEHNKAVKMYNEGFFEKVIQQIQSNLILQPTLGEPLYYLLKISPDAIKIATITRDGISVGIYQRSELWKLEPKPRELASNYFQ